MGIGWECGLDLDWAFDLVSADPKLREAARRKHAAVQQRYAAARRRVDEFSTSTGTPWPPEPHLSAEMDQRRSAANDAAQYALLPTVTQWTKTRDHHLLPYALLYLEWEAKYPKEWQKNWPLKSKTLRALSHHKDHPPWLREKLRDLVEAAIKTTQGCENRHYVTLARSLEDPTLKHTLKEITQTTTNNEAALKAKYLLHMLKNPHLPPTPKTWQTWLRTDQ